MILFACEVCEAQLYFESTKCVQCHSPLGYLVEQRAISALQPMPDSPQAGPTYTAHNAAARNRAFKRCKHGVQHGACNWMLPADAEADYCASCSLTEVIPDLSCAENKQQWATLEAAKRRLLFTLYSLQLPVEPGSGSLGLAFRFLRSTPEQPVTTGHDNGIITLNIAEANAAFRENERERLGEAYRTPLGHFRHEIGHYYFDRLVAGSSHLEGFRELFGDETQSYEQALARHYSHGPPADWQDAFISGYATMHPWEDWAETWAHYLHMVDTLETAKSYGLAIREPLANRRGKPIKVQAVDFDDFDDLMQRFHPVTLALNALNRSMGLADAYPFAISPGARDKLAFVHHVIVRARTNSKA